MFGLISRPLFLKSYSETHALRHNTYSAMNINVHKCSFTNQPNKQTNTILKLMLGWIKSQTVWFLFMEHTPRISFHTSAV